MESENKILQQDIECIAKAELAWNVFENKTFFITGATGLLGSILIKGLLARNRIFNSKIKIIALARNREKVERIFNKTLNRKELTFIYGTIEKLPKILQQIDFIVHGANPTASKEFVEKPVETINSIFKGTKNTLELAKQKKVLGYLYLSSMEIYGITEKNMVQEGDYGSIDSTSPRSSYSEGKKLAECLCASYAKEFGVNAKIARLTQTFGAGIDISDNRVFAQFAKAVVEKKNIVLKTLGDTKRNYCYTTDAITAMLYILAKGNSGEAYNVASKETAISIKDMAQIAANIFPENGIKVVFDLEKNIEKLGYPPSSKILLSTEKLEKLGWSSDILYLTGLKRCLKDYGGGGGYTSKNEKIEEMFKRTIEWLM